MSKEELEQLAFEIYDWYDSDMGTHFDEIQGNEEEVYTDILSALENKDEDMINTFLDFMSEADERDEIAPDIINKLQSLLNEKQEERFLGPDEETIQDSKEKGLYTESNDDVFEDENGTYRYGFYERECPMCKKHYGIIEDNIKNDIGNYINQFYDGVETRKPIQDVFPELNPMEREFIKTGYCPECQEKLFGSNYTSDIIKPVSGDGKMYITESKRERVECEVEAILDNAPADVIDKVVSKVIDKNVNVDSDKFETVVKAFAKNLTESIKIKTLKLENDKFVADTEQDDTIGEIKEDGTVIKEFYGQGLIYKNFKNFEQKSGPCYIAEYQGENDTGFHDNIVSDELKTKNFNDMVEGMDYETYDTILKKVRDEYAYRNMKVSEQTVEDTAKEIFYEVDWQNVQSLIDEWLDGEEEAQEGIKTEYALDIRDKEKDEFLYQYDVYKTYEEAEKNAQALNLKDNENFHIVEIKYDENGNEIGTEIVNYGNTLKEGLELDDEETKFINNMVGKSQAEIENFLGYDLTPEQFDDKQGLRLAIKEIYEQMPEEELNKFECKKENKYKVDRIYTPLAETKKKVSNRARRIKTESNDIFTSILDGYKGFIVDNNLDGYRAEMITIRTHTGVEEKPAIVTTYNGIDFGFTTDLTGRWDITHIDTGLACNKYYNSFDEAVADLPNIVERLNLLHNKIKGHTQKFNTLKSLRDNVNNAKTIDELKVIVDGIDGVDDKVKTHIKERLDANNDLDIDDLRGIVFSILKDSSYYLEESLSPDIVDKINSAEDFTELLDVLDSAGNDAKIQRARNLTSHAYTHTPDEEEDERFVEIKDEVLDILTESKEQWYGYNLIGVYTDKDGVKHKDELAHAYNTDYLKHYAKEHKSDLSKYEDMYILDTDKVEIETTDGEITQKIPVEESLNESLDALITESYKDGWKPDVDLYTKLMKEMQDNLGISEYEIQKEADSIKFRYNGKVYFAEPRSTCQVDIFDDNHKQIGWGVITDKIKQEVFTDYITNQDYIYHLVGGEYAGTYTREEAEKLPIKEPELTDEYTSDNPDAIQPRKELQNQFQFKGYLGPMWDGTEDGKAVIRYETPEVYDMLSR